MRGNFLLGVVVGVGATWAFHRWVRPMNTNTSR